MNRMEYDLVGEMAVDADAYYGIHALRAAENFPITHTRLPGDMIVSMAWIKKACARANRVTGALSSRVAEAIERACDELIDGKLHDQFIVDPIQGGAGTSTNMNANEVIANRAIELLGGVKGDYTLVHPNDHVNCGQSTNDIYPTCVKMTLYRASESLRREMEALVSVLEERAVDFDGVIKMGRTQLQDAVPIRLGQEFSAYAAVMRRECARLERGQKELLVLNLGGTAVGTGINASAAYIGQVVPILSGMTGISFTQSPDLVDATQNTDCYLTLSAALKSCAASLSKMCNDLRLMSSGPRDGLGEISLPARQNGSSIMPGKVNPTQCEAVTMVAVQVMANDTAVGMAASQGNFELNVFMPVCIYNFLQSVRLLADCMDSFNDNCAAGITADREKCRHNLHNSLMLVTALNPYIGYDNAAKTAKLAHRENISLKDACVKLGFLTPEKFDEVFHPEEMV